jgi:putative transposase
MLSNHLHRDRTIVYNCKTHVVFCPKYRRSVLVPPIDSRILEVVKSCIEEQQGT